LLSLNNVIAPIKKNGRLFEPTGGHYLTDVTNCEAEELNTYTKPTKY